MDGFESGIDKGVLSKVCQLFELLSGTSRQIISLNTNQCDRSVGYYQRMGDQPA